MLNLFELQALEQAILQQHPERVQTLIAHMNPADLAVWIEQLSLQAQVRLIPTLEQAALIFEFLPKTVQAQIAEQLDPADLLQLMSAMHSDDRTDLFKGLSPTLQPWILAELAPEKRQQIQQLAAYPEESAGAIMSSDFVTLSPELTIQQAIEQLRQVAADRETLYLIYIVDALQHLLGVVSLRQIIQAAPEVQLQHLMTTDLVMGQVDEDQEQIAWKLAHYVEAETTEDILKSGAIESLPNLSLKNAPILSLYRQRVFWLVFLVFGSLLSGFGIAHFEEIIAAHIVLVFFLPLLVGSGGNAGAQSATLMVRALATGDVHFRDWFYLLGRESLVALCLGGTMALAVSVLGYVRGDLMVAVVLALSMLGIVLMGCLVGMSLPFILNKLKLDPASASAPLVTSICDASGVVVYLFIASQLLF